MQDLTSPAASTEEIKRLSAANPNDTGTKHLEIVAPEDAAPAGGLAAIGGIDMLQAMSRMIYSGSYAVAYGAVYSAVFLAQWFPTANPVAHGCRDGGNAAMREFEAG
jgi:hypothetical protein